MSYLKILIEKKSLKIGFLDKKSLIIYTKKELKYISLLKNHLTYFKHIILTSKENFKILK